MRRSALLVPAVSLLAGGALCLGVSHAQAQTYTHPWNGYAHDPQHTAKSLVASQPLIQIHWHTPVDYTIGPGSGEIYKHYGSISITKHNTVLIPVTNASGGFQVEARSATTGALKWMRTTDYVLPPHDWVPSFGPTINTGTPVLTVYYPGAAGTVQYRQTPDDKLGVHGRISFYGDKTFDENTSALSSQIYINTPITTDSVGNIYFGFMVTATPNAAKLTGGGIARLGVNGSRSFAYAATMTNDSSMDKCAHNCAPALSGDGTTLYVAINNGSGGGGASGSLVALDSASLRVKAFQRLTDPFSGSDADVDDDGTPTPLVGPDGDVYYGVLENPWNENHLQGWLLHFSGDLSAEKFPVGAFGWDDTPSIVPKAAVPSYTGTSSYLLACKYNNYLEGGGDGMNRVAIVDPNASETDPFAGSGTTWQVMNEVMTIVGPSPDPRGGYKEWCINSAAVDPYNKCVIVNSEDGNCYKWDLTTGKLSPGVTLFPGGIGEAYTSTIIGPDGQMYATNDAVLYALGQ